MGALSSVQVVRQVLDPGRGSLLWESRDSDKGQGGQIVLLRIRDLLTTVDPSPPYRSLSLPLSTSSRGGLTKAELQYPMQNSEHLCHGKGDVISCAILKRSKIQLEKNDYTTYEYVWILVCTRVCTWVCSGNHLPAPCPLSESGPPGAVLRSAAPACGLPFRPPELLTRRRCGLPAAALNVTSLRPFQPFARFPRLGSATVAGNTLHPRGQRRVHMATNVFQQGQMDGPQL